MLAAALWVLLTLPVQVAKPVTIPDADLKVLVDPKTPKHAETIAKYAGRLVKLTANVHARESTGSIWLGGSGFRTSGGGMAYSVTHAGKLADGRIPLVWATGTKRDPGRARADKAGEDRTPVGKDPTPATAPTSVRLTLYGRLATNTRGGPMLVGASSVSEKHVPPAPKKD